jgi:hypothetical protein
VTAWKSSSWPRDWVYGSERQSIRIWLAGTLDTHKPARSPRGSASTYQFSRVTHFVRSTWVHLARRSDSFLLWREVSQLLRLPRGRTLVHSSTYHTRTQFHAEVGIARRVMLVLRRVAPSRPRRPGSGAYTTTTELGANTRGVGRAREEREAAPALWRRGTQPAPCSPMHRTLALTNPRALYMWM